jgi:hypothetical protein
MEPIKIEYYPQLKEYFEANSLYNSKTIHGKIDKIASYFFIIVGIIMIGISFILNYHFINIILGIIIIIIVILNISGFIDFEKIVIMIQFKNNKKLKSIQKLIFTDTGIEYETQDIKSNITWNIYNKYYEGENIFILIYGKRQYSVIPKNKFENRLDDFKKIINENIKWI